MAAAAAATTLLGRVVVGCGVTLEEEEDVKLVGCTSGIFLVKQLAIAEHLPSFSELETE